MKNVSFFISPHFDKTLNSRLLIWGHTVVPLAHYIIPWNLIHIKVHGIAPLELYGKPEFDDPYLTSKHLSLLMI